MKKIISIVFAFIILIWWVFSLDYFDRSSTVYTNDQREVISEIDWDSIRSWVSEVARDVNWIIDYEILDSDDAQYETLTYVRRIFNYFLMFLASVALVYLLYHGFLMVTAAWNEERYKKGLKWISFAVIAIVWVWVSWMIISLVFWVVTKVV